MDQDPDSSVAIKRHCPKATKEAKFNTKVWIQGRKEAKFKGVFGAAVERGEAKKVNFHMQKTLRPWKWCVDAIQNVKLQRFQK